ncbi:PLP-dependent aspartate aminotransferase family protein [Halomonas sp. DN3]|uniref:trans-sulfuration enzyme family protein n=1 Tax=Halomonas sp. DN3 TaxID=2953657 RepID=UPI00209C7EF5|nr:aminotransferase class I/II-fold pyridoxal phosphate-dependent enzyme [Halomonas sp. DN3]USZ49505.1 aminotransferase class I/II-fold pyridoxal phosphate-dependent enzyme [Halomonas sp. DN3]
MDPQDRHICSHAFEQRQDHHGAVAPPVYQTSIFTFPDLESFSRAQLAERERFIYSRGLNPTVKLLEDKLAALERGQACKAFASGMGAISATLFSLLKHGDHVLRINQTYGPSVELLDHMARYGVSHDGIAGDQQLTDHLRPETRLIYIESPSSLRMELADLEAISAIARKRGILTLIDNTWATPLFQKPLTHGIDMVVHSLSKYIGGHSDVVGGAVIADAELIDRLFANGHQLLGAALSPHSASLILRGLRTLPVRMAEHQRNALAVARFLADHPQVAAVHHPSLAKGAAADWAARQLHGHSGLLSLALHHPSYSRIANFIDALELMRIGVSWGGYESLALSPMRPDGSGQPLIRLAIGLEHIDDIVDDLERGFAALER